MGGGRSGGDFETPGEKKMPMALEAWMPKKVELKNKYEIFQVEDEKRSNCCD